MIQDVRIRWALAVIGLAVLGGSGFALWHARQAGPPPVVISAAAVTPPPPAGPANPPVHAPRSKIAPARIYVHVAGAVRRPWLYPLPAGSRVMQAVLAAGGPTAQADLDAVNLAEPVRDGEKVYVPVKAALAAPIPPPTPPGNALGHVSVMLDAKPSSPTPSPAPMPTVIEPGLPTMVASKSSSKRHGGAKSDKLTSPDQGQININTADAAELERLPGVGPAMAARILAFREQAHGFQSIQEIQEVGGIGPKKFAKIAPFIVASP